MILANFGTFDVRNYGDSLFPLIVEQQLGEIFSEFVHVSPVGGRAYEDVPTSISYQQFQKDGRKVDAVMIAGGNILHARRTPLVEYHDVERTAYASLWAGAAKAAARNDVPLIINSPGVPRPPGALTGSVMRAVFNQAAYASVRDHQSLRNLRLGKNSRVQVVPDTALLLPETLSKSVPTHKTNEIAVHINDRYATSDLSEIARTLDRIASTLQKQIHLIGIGVCHGDDDLAQSISKKMQTNHQVLADPQNVNDVARVIANASLYVGSSLHGFITASSYSVPAIIVADGSQQHKFDGLLSQLAAEDRMLTSWKQVLDDASKSNSAPDSIFNTPVEMESSREAIHYHWKNVSVALAGNHKHDEGVLRYISNPPLLLAGANIIEQIPSRIGAQARRLLATR